MLLPGRDGGPQSGRGRGRCCRLGQTALSDYFLRSCEDIFWNDFEVAHALAQNLGLVGGTTQGSQSSLSFFGHGRGHFVYSLHLLFLGRFSHVHSLFRFQGDVQGVDALKIGGCFMEFLIYLKDFRCVRIIKIILLHFSREKRFANF